MEIPAALDPDGRWVLRISTHISLEATVLEWVGGTALREPYGPPQSKLSYICVENLASATGILEQVLRPFRRFGEPQMMPGERGTPLHQEPGLGRCRWSLTRSGQGGDWGEKM